MGHVRLGKLPRTKKWREVVSLIASGADVSQVADATLKAAEDAFEYVNINEDEGFNQAAWIMVQLGIAAKADDPIEHLKNQGVDLTGQTSMSGIQAAISDAMDNHLEQCGRKYDLGEIAQRALIEAISNQIKPRLEGRLFSVTPDDIRGILSEFRKQKEFSQLSKQFFSVLSNRCMDYFLSRTLSSQIGEGQRFASMNEKSQFDQALKMHCHEAAKIVEEYSGGWFSKHMYEEAGNISRESVKGFASYGMKKMTDELKAGAKHDAK